MGSISLIFFRETLEISIIVSTILASINHMNNKNFITILGLSLGIIGAGLLACITNKLTQLVNGSGQEIFNATVSFISSFMIAYTVIWMRVSCKKKQSYIIDKEKLTSNSLSTRILTLIIALTMLREGSEIVLFSYGVIISHQYSFISFTIEALIGILLSLTITIAYYYGLNKIYTRYLFKVTSWLLIFLSANLASQGANFLASVDILPEIVAPVWNSSWIISQESVIGQILNSLFGYIEAPSALQLIFYISVIILIRIGIKIFSIKCKKT